MKDPEMHKGLYVTTWQSPQGNWNMIPPQCWWDVSCNSQDAMILQGQHGVVRKFPRLGLDCVTPMSPQFSGVGRHGSWEPISTPGLQRLLRLLSRLAGRWTAASSLEPALAA